MNRRTYDEAGTQLRRAQGLLLKLVDEFPTVAQYSSELAAVEDNLGTLAAYTNHPDQAVAAFQQSTGRLETLKSRFPASPAYRMKLAVCQVHLAGALGATAPAKAEASLRTALDEQSALLAQYPGIPEYQLEVARAHFQLGSMLLNSKPPEAVIEAEKAKSLDEDVRKTWPESEPALGCLLRDHYLLCQALWAAGRFPKAIAVAEQVPELRSSDPTFYVHAVGLLIKCAEATADTPDGRTQKEDCLARAVGIIRKAIESKVIRSKSKLRKFQDFAPLRNRDDFRRLPVPAADAEHVG